MTRLTRRAYSGPGYDPVRPPGTVWREGSARGGGGEGDGRAAPDAKPSQLSVIPAAAKPQQLLGFRHQSSCQQELDFPDA